MVIIPSWMGTEVFVRAKWRGVVLAESEHTVVVEGNHYFPPESINRKYFQKSTLHTTCPWKGEASYCDLVTDDTHEVNKDATWYYPEPKEAANHIKNHFAFSKTVVVE